MQFVAQGVDMVGECDGCCDEGCCMIDCSGGGCCETSIHDGNTTIINNYYWYSYGPLPSDNCCDGCCSGCCSTKNVVYVTYLHH